MQQPNWGIGRRSLKSSGSRKDRHHTFAVGLLWTSDQLVAEKATYTTHNKHQRRTSIPLEGFESASPAMKRRKTYAFDRAATGNGFEVVGQVFSMSAIASCNRRLSLLPPRLSRFDPYCRNIVGNAAANICGLHRCTQEWLTLS